MTGGSYMNGLAWNGRRAEYCGAVRWPLTMTWKEQLIAEAESAVRTAETGAELGRAVWALAKVACGHMERMTTAELLFVQAETVARKVAACLTLPEDAARLLLDLSSFEEDGSSKITKDAAGVRELRKLAVRLIQYTRSIRRALAVIR